MEMNLARRSDEDYNALQDVAGEELAWKAASHDGST
jgi:hypothetical protein